jgi:superoxide dismutase, Cu-Zn family
MKRTAIMLALGSLLLAGCASMKSPSSGPSATAELRNTPGQNVGRAVLTTEGTAVRVVLTVQGLPPGAKGVHIHEVGKCDAPEFPTAGRHFNPDKRQHGMDNPQGPHAGDLPNLIVGGDGTGRLETTTPRISLASGAPTSLFDADGSAIVVHAGPDDMKTDPDGNSGERIACGVIVPAGSTGSRY